MKLLTEEIKRQLPPLYSQEHNPEPKAVIKLFTPWSNWTWYVMEFDGEDLFFGLVDGHCKEFGYFSLSELQNLIGPFGLKIERDLFFEPTPISKLVGEAAALNS